MRVTIERQDIKLGGHGNNDDPLVRALNRLYSTGAPWRSEVYSAGRSMVKGQTWDRHGTHHDIPADLTDSLQRFDRGEPMAPCTVDLI